MRKRRHSLDRRRQALARQLIIYGKRQERDAEFAGGLHRPITMSERDAMAAYEWLLDKPLRFWIRATVYCRDDAGTSTTRVARQRPSKPPRQTSWRHSACKCSLKRGRR